MNHSYTANIENALKHMLNERIETYGITSLHDEEFLSSLTGVEIIKCRESQLRLR